MWAVVFEHSLLSFSGLDLMAVLELASVRVVVEFNFRASRREVAQ